jgi:phosphoglycolate phosphatase
MSVRAGVLFDLDGTLADTAPDLAAALNALLVEEGRAALHYETIRPWVSWGAPRLVRLAFGDALEGGELQRLRGRLLTFYEAGLCRHSRVFPAMEQVLAELELDGIPWGIVTNKPGWLTDPLVGALGLSERAGAVISGDTLPYAKPHPLPLQHGARELGVAPERCIYVGDAARDIEAGRAAGMFTVAASWGYIPDGEDPLHWAADRLIHEPGELSPVVKAFAQRGAA